MKATYKLNEKTGLKELVATAEAKVLSLNNTMHKNDHDTQYRWGVVEVFDGEKSLGESDCCFYAKVIDNLYVAQPDGSRAMPAKINVELTRRDGATRTFCRAIPSGDFTRKELDILTIAEVPADYPSAGEPAITEVSTTD